MSDISKCEYHAIIKFLTSEKQPANNIHKCLVRVYGESAPLYTYVVIWRSTFVTLFHDDNEIKQASESYLDRMPQEFYLTGIKELFDRCNKYIAVKGDYLEK